MSTTRSDEYTSINKKAEIYSDFMTNLIPHPDTKELVRITNEAAVLRSIRNLVQTNRFDRVMQPNLGCNIQNLLFEPMTAITAEAIRTTIIETIENYEKRARIENVIVEENEQLNYYRVTIVFYIINKTDPVVTNLTLYRVR